MESDELITMKKTHLKLLLIGIVIGFIITCLTGLIPNVLGIGLDEKWLYLVDGWNGSASGLPVIYIYDITHVYGYLESFGMSSSVGFHFDTLGFFIDFILWSLLVFVVAYLYTKKKR